MRHLTIGIIIVEKCKIELEKFRLSRASGYCSTDTRYSLYAWIVLGRHCFCRCWNGHYNEEFFFLLYSSPSHVVDNSIDIRYYQMDSIPFVNCVTRFSLCVVLGVVAIARNLPWSSIQYPKEAVNVNTTHRKQSAKNRKSINTNKYIWLLFLKIISILVGREQNSISSVRIRCIFVLSIHKSMFWSFID